MLDPRTLPADSPPSPKVAATVDTESSGKDVVTESRMKPAAISDRPKTLDSTRTYRMTLSLSTAISDRDKISKGTLYHAIHDALTRVVFRN